LLFPPSDDIFDCEIVDSVGLTNSTVLVVIVLGIVVIIVHAHAQSGNRMNPETNEYAVQFAVF